MIYLLNAIAGVLFIYIMYRLIKAIYVAYKSPKKILNDAIEDERERKERINANIRSLKDISRGKMIPVVKAVEEMRGIPSRGEKISVRIRGRQVAHRNQFKGIRCVFPCG